ncbi:hypothetical protein NSS70_08860 [Aeribacillus sp. FSL K6-2848]|nr:hypothetical protein APP_15450 [Aeribacillus pallidus]
MQFKEHFLIGDLIRLLPGSAEETLILSAVLQTYWNKEQCPDSTRD